MNIKSTTKKLPLNLIFDLGGEVHRIIFHHPLPEKLIPTLAILIAPPATAFTAYVKLTHNVDSFAKILYYFALFLTTFLLAEYKMFSKIKFYLSWWA